MRPAWGLARRPTSVAAGEHHALYTEVRAALGGGAAPAAALVAAVLRDPGAPAELVALAQAVRLGLPLADAAVGVATGDPALDLLVRALAVAEVTGAGTLAAVDQALAAAADAAETARRLRVATAQARGTARVLTVLPIAAWLLFCGLDRSLLAFYATPMGAATGVVALTLAGAGRAWAGRLVARGARGGQRADALAAPPAPRDLRRAATLALPALLVAGFGLGPLAGVATATVLALIGLCRPSGAGAADPSGGGAAETVELVAVALASGLSPVAAVGVVAPLAPPAARSCLGAAARRLRGGEPADSAFADGGLAPLGAVLAAGERWGAPAEPALRRLAAELRATRRAAAEESAERVQLALVFPTTLLTLPAFTVGVVPPLLWSAFTGAGG